MRRIQVNISIKIPMENRETLELKGNNANNHKNSTHKAISSTSRNFYEIPHFPLKFLPKLVPWICAYFADWISDRGISTSFCG